MRGGGTGLAGPDSCVEVCPTALPSLKPNPGRQAGRQAGKLAGRQQAGSRQASMHTGNMRPGLHPPHTSLPCAPAVTWR